MSLRYIPLNDGYPGNQKRMLPLKKEIVLAKKAYLEKYAIAAQEGSNANGASKLFESAINKDASVAGPSPTAVPITNTGDANKIKDLLDKVSMLQEELANLKQKIPASSSSSSSSSSEVLSVKVKYCP